MGLPNILRSMLGHCSNYLISLFDKDYGYCSVKVQYIINKYYDGKKFYQKIKQNTTDKLRKIHRKSDKLAVKANNHFYMWFV